MDMLETMTPGFTGTVWESRPPEQLARDLTTGPGAKPAADAGLAWARLGASFGTAAAEYDRIIAGLGEGWQSQGSASVLAKISPLRDWLLEAAAAAAANAGHAETHAAAHELARITMPDAGSLQALRQLQRTLETVGEALGAPMLGELARLDGETDLAKGTAARVMRVYEQATEPLATPWESEAPPTIVSGAALESERATAGPRAPESAPVKTSGVPGGMPTAFPRVPLARVRTAYQARTASVTTQSTVVQPAATTTESVTHGRAMPMAPMGAGAGAAAQQEEEHTPRAGVAGTETEFDGPSVQAAPAVLGGVEPRAVPNAESAAEQSGTPTTGEERR